MTRFPLQKKIALSLILLFTIVCINPIISGNLIINNNEGHNEILLKKNVCNSLITFGADIQKLSASDGKTDARFGCSVSIDDDYAIIGAVEDNENGYRSGSAYIFKLEGTIWTEQTKLLPSDGLAYQNFGVSVYIDGEYAIIGATGDDSNGLDSGSAYIFKREGTIWTEQTKLLPSDGEEDYIFGGCVSLYGDFAIIGSTGDKENGEYSGSAYIFKREGTIWTEQTKLLPSDGEQFESFGRSVAIDGDYTIIGAPGDNDNGYVAGSAYIFKRNGNLWSEQSKLLASDGEKYDYFGRSVSIDGQYVIIGAWGDESRSGSAYIFKREGEIWTQLEKMSPSDIDSGDYFGFSVSINGDYAIVGAEGDNAKAYGAGSAYIFKRNGVTWSKHAKLLAPDGEEKNWLGCSVSLNEDNVIIGALGADGNKPKSGSAYLFKNICQYQPPNIPLIKGPSKGKPGVEYTFYISTNDPNNDDIYYYIDWGDETDSNWLGPYESDKEITVSHKWDEKGNYKIRARAKDIFDCIGEWSEISISVPRSRTINNPFLKLLLENYPILYQLLKEYYS